MLGGMDRHTWVAAGRHIEATAYGVFDLGMAATETPKLVGTEVPALEILRLAERLEVKEAGDERALLREREEAVAAVLADRDWWRKAVQRQEAAMQRDAQKDADNRARIGALEEQVRELERALSIQEGTAPLGGMNLTERIVARLAERAREAEGRLAVEVAHRQAAERQRNDKVEEIRSLRNYIQEAGEAQAARLRLMGVLRD